MRNKTEFLGKTKMSKLIMKQATPAILAMFVMSLYQIVDAIFIGHFVGTLGIASIAIVMPIMMLLMAIAQMIGIGFASIISRTLGEENINKTEKTFTNYFSTIIISSIIFTILGIIFQTEILKLFGANMEILPFAKDYAKVIFYGLFFLMFVVSSNNIIRAQGQAKIAMITMLIGAVINLILDPIFIYLLNLGMFGAALATSISYIISSIFVIWYFIFGKNPISFNKNYIIPDLKILKEVFAIGSSSFIRQGSSSLVSIIMNHLLLIYSGSLAIAAYAIIRRFQMFIMMPLFGFVQAMQPIVGFNYGAKKYDRVKEALKLTIQYATIWTIIPFIIIISFPDFLIKLFTSDKSLIEFGIPFMRYVFLLFPLVGIYMIFGGFFQSLGKAKISLMISLLRQVFILFPLLMILSFKFGLIGLFIAYPIADLLSLIITYIIYKKNITKIFSK